MKASQLCCYLFSAQASAFSLFATPTVRRSLIQQKAAESTDASIPLGKKDAKKMYKKEVDALGAILDEQEEETLERMKTLVKQIRELRSSNPEVALSAQMRDALAKAHSASNTHGEDSTEAQVAWGAVEALSASESEKHDLNEDLVDLSVLDHAVDAINALEDMTELSHIEKKLVDRYGLTDFGAEYEGFLDRPIGREDDGISLWP